jgi:hypothetical protein
MTDSERIEFLEKQVSELTRNYESVLRVLWTMRGEAKGEAQKIEKELEVAWVEYLAKHKVGV